MAIVIPQRNTSTQEIKIPIKEGSGNIRIPSRGGGIPERPGIFQEFFKPEIGAVETILSPFFTKRAEELVRKERESLGEMTKLYKRLPAGEHKQRVRGYLETAIKRGPIVKFKDIIPTAKKNTSQVIGEAISLGLLLTPFPEIKALKSTSFTRRAVSGGIVATGFGAAYGLAEEGELKEKAPTIAAMAGVGFVGGGILSGVLPPLLKAVPKTTKAIFSRVLPSKTEEKVILPTIRYVKKQVGKIKTTQAVQKTTGLLPTTNKVNQLDKKLYTEYNRLENLLVNTQFIGQPAGARTATKIVTPQIIKKQGDLVMRLQREITSLTKKRNKLFEKSAHKSLKAGDEIFSSEIGRVKIIQFMRDEAGQVMITGADINGRVVSLMSDDLIKMKKILKPQTQIMREFVGLADIPANAVKLNKVQTFMFGLKRYIKTTKVLLEELGMPGKQLSALLDKTIREEERLWGKTKLPIVRLVNKLGLAKSKTALTNIEIKNIVDILDSGLKMGAKSFDEIPTKATSDRVRQFLDMFYGVTKPLVDDANKLGLMVRDKVTGKKYSLGEGLIHFPHIPKDIEKLKKAMPELVKLQMKRQNLTKKEATVLLNNFVKNFTTNRYAGLEQRRTLFIEGFAELEKYGYETNPIVALTDFVVGSAKRLAEANNFGKENELVARLIDDIGLWGYDNGLAQEVWNRYVGSKEVAHTVKDFASAIKTFQVVTKLPLAAITNSTQLVNTATEFGVRQVLKGFKKFLFQRVSTQEAGLLAGVTDETISAAMRLAGADTKVAQKFLRNIGFTSVEKMNRLVTVASSQSWAKETLTKLLKDRSNPKIIRHFKQLGISDIKKVLDRGIFTAEELNIIGQKAVQSTQFRGSVLDIPLYWSSPQGTITTQFKSFAWQQGTFVKKIIIDEARQGNMQPLLTYLVLSEITGEAVKDIRDFLKGDFTFREDISLFERMLDNIFSVGGFGLAGDLFERMFMMAKGKYYISTADLLAGPTAGDLITGIDSVSKLFGGNYKSFTKFAGREAAMASLIPQLQVIPGAGVILRVIGDIAANIITSDDF